MHKWKISLVLVGLFILGSWQFGAAQDWQKHVLQFPRADSCRANLLRLTEEPHVAGSEADEANANYILNKLLAFGLDAEIVSYDVYLPYPREVVVQMLRPIQFDGPTPEEGFPVDKDSYASDILPGFNAYSPSGEVAAQVVYVNYGRPEDYDALQTLGVSVAGKIALARYGKNFRGVKARVAEEHDAIGLLIYSDPADDGYMKGDIFPRGPFRPKTGVQRGSIEFLSIYPGDPLTPGTPATSSAERIDPADAANLPGIPTTPLGYGDAQMILQYLAGANVPEGWQGGLPFAYHTGPGPAEVRMKLDMDFQIRPIWNVIARIKGAKNPEQFVIIGNHHDAWTYGAVDPSSGTATLLEISRALGELVKAGYRPQRSIVFAFWDGEEYGLLGSTEWVEENRAEIMQNCVAYINIDVAVAGNRFGASASPGLKRFVQDIIREINDPKSANTILEKVWLAQDKKRQPADLPDFSEPADSLAVHFGDLGSGSDYTAFFDFAGVPSLSMSFGGQYGVYHAAYDNFYWMQQFGDPDFVYHETMAKIGASMVLRLADARLIPFDIATYARELAKHAEATEKKLRAAGAPDDVSMQRVIEKCKTWQQTASALPAAATIPGDIDTAEMNALLRKFERLFLDEQGLPGRPWYKHVLFAPGYYLGYGAEPFPGVAYAMLKQDWQLFQDELDRILLKLDAAAQTTQKIIDLTRN